MAGDAITAAERRRGWSREVWLSHQRPSMNAMSRQPQDLRPGRQDRPGGQGPLVPDRNWRWVVFVLVAMLVLVIFASNFSGSSNRKTLGYGEFLNDLSAKPATVKNATVNNNSGKITGDLTDGTNYVVNGPKPPTDDELKMLQDSGIDLKFSSSSSNFLAGILPLLLYAALIIGFFIWMSRRAQGQMTGLMSVGRSKAKVYTTERPRTTFNDVAGYEGVKMEIKEVVDFLKQPGRFKEMGARIPKGVLLVGPPGTGKTLLARAVAGEAGVPFLSVTGSDFMEMFVGVGASRVRDLFQTARKQAPAIIFVDEIDSIGRKRGAGLGGGHDEREQTLNQMLAEMDGFETSEGIVIMAATNRPDILDPALLRPGRFDRQIVVPLPENDERLAILKVHSRDKKMGPDVDLAVMAKGTPGMSGADLANLVNEAALFAVRRGSRQIERIDFESARDRVIMGARRESLVLTAEEKRTTAYHEGGRVSQGAAAGGRGAARGGEAHARLSRGRPRRPGRRSPQRRPGAQGHHPPDRHGSRRHPDDAGGAPLAVEGVHRGPPLHGPR